MANTGLELEAALGDCAYGTGPNRQRFAEAGVTLLAKVPVRPETGLFSKDEFAIDLDAQSCRCPAGEVTRHLVSAGASKNAAGERMPLKAFQFSATQCGPCALRERCFTKNQHGRLVRLNPYEALHQAARQWQRGDEFAVFRKQRQVVEHRLARMVQLGIRQARYVGREKTLLQALMVAAVANLTLIGGQVLGSRLPTITTTALMALGAALTVAVAVRATMFPTTGNPGWRVRLPILARLRMAGSRPDL